MVLIMENKKIMLLVVLILIILIIYCFNLIPYLTERKNKKKAATEVLDISPVAQEEVALTDDLELIAVISAAIAASEGTSADGFVVRSIRRR